MGDTLQNRITSDSAICNGKPTIRGLRLTVQIMLEYLGADEGREKILRQFPKLEPEDINTCLAFASSRMSHRYSLKEIVCRRALSELQN